MTEPDQFMIDHALRVAAGSPCRSKRGVVLYDMQTGAFRGAGYNGPPRDAPCPGRAVCAGICGQRSVHAETRALRAGEVYRTLGHPPGPYDLIHVELAADGGVVACDGPSCWQCAREVLDVGFVGGVWLYLGVSRCLACRRFEDSSDKSADRWRRCPECGTDMTPQGAWRRYTAEELYRVTLERCGMVP